MKKQSSYEMQSEEGDILDLIIEDHKPLKQLIKIMKDADKYSIGQRRDAFEDFAPLLTIHAKPEEQSLYIFMKSDNDTIVEGYEGDVEHGIAEQLMEEIKTTENEDLWSARVKVLAEMVEHHIEEEEEEMFPDVRKNSELAERAKLGTLYMQLKTQFDAEGNFMPVDRVSEQYAERHMQH
ncbi:MAG: hemerythrin domain-containing protein [Rhizobacter sp.]|nr:hemerythrin domain-containing protein [Bacteriovorax sp.]